MVISGSNSRTQCRPTPVAGTSPWPETSESRFKSSEAPPSTMIRLCSDCCEKQKLTRSFHGSQTLVSNEASNGRRRRRRRRDVTSSSCVRWRRRLQTSPLKREGCRKPERPAFPGVICRHFQRPTLHIPFTHINHCGRPMIYDGRVLLLNGDHWRRFVSLAAGRTCDMKISVNHAKLN